MYQQKDNVRIKFNELVSSTAGVFRKGHEYDVADDFGREVVKANLAVEIQPADETEAKAKPAKAGK